MVDGETHYCCSLCGKHYRQKRYVCRHFKVQHGGQKYTCPYCTYTSGWKENINSHILRKHKGTV